MKSNNLTIFLKIVNIFEPSMTAIVIDLICVTANGSNCQALAYDRQNNRSTVNLTLVSLSAIFYFTTKH